MPALRSIRFFILYNFFSSFFFFPVFCLSSFFCYDAAVRLSRSCSIKTYCLNGDYVSVWLCLALGCFKLSDFHCSGSRNLRVDEQPRSDSSSSNLFMSFNKCFSARYVQLFGLAHFSPQAWKTVRREWTVGFTIKTKSVNARRISTRQICGLIVIRETSILFTWSRSQQIFIYFWHYRIFRIVSGCNVCMRVCVILVCSRESNFVTRYSFFCQLT